MLLRWRPELNGPVWRALKRLFRQDVRIVTGGIAFYALFSIFPLIYLTLTLLTVFLPPDIARDLTKPITELFTDTVEPLSDEEVEAIRQMTPAGLSLRAFLALLLVLFTATSGAKAAMTGVRMIAGSEGRTRFARFQGLSLLMTGSLILLVWVMGGLQLAMTLIGDAEGDPVSGFMRNLTALANTLWITKFIAGFVVFYIILALSLRGHVQRGTRAIAAGAAAGALAFLGVTFLFQLYLNYSVLGTIYGALASLILAFIWLSASVMSLLLGAALAAEWSQAWGDGEAASEAE